MDVHRHRSVKPGGIVDTIPCPVGALGSRLTSLRRSVVTMTAIVGFCSSIHTAAISAVAEDLECSIAVSTLGVSTFLLGFAIGPLIYAPLSEIYGRNPVYRATFFLFVVFNIGCALSPNIAALLIFRFLCGFFGSPTGESLGQRLLNSRPMRKRTEHTPKSQIREDL